MLLKHDCTGNCAVMGKPGIVVPIYAASLLFFGVIVSNSVPFDPTDREPVIVL
jgi:hypothetical protein